MTDLDPIILNSLQTSLAVGILFFIVLLVRRPFARQFGAKAAYALWLVPLARLFMPPLPAGFTIFGLAGPAAAPKTAHSVERCWPGWIYSIWVTRSSFSAIRARGGSRQYWPMPMWSSHR